MECMECGGRMVLIEESRTKHNSFDLECIECGHVVYNFKDSMLASMYGCGIMAGIIILLCAVKLFIDIFS